MWYGIYSYFNFNLFIKIDKLRGKKTLHMRFPAAAAAPGYLPTLRHANR